MVINNLFLSKISQDYKRVSGKFVKTIPQEVIQLEDTINQLTDLINIERDNTEPDNATIQALEAQRIRTRQQLAAQKTKYGL